jgi:hypothetical protein
VDSGAPSSVDESPVVRPSRPRVLAELTSQLRPGREQGAVQSSSCHPPGGTASPGTQGLSCGTEPAGNRTLAISHARPGSLKNGRLVLDEPTDLPEGAEVEVLVIDDELTAEERAELHASLDRALDDSDAGRGMDAWELL